MSNEVAALGVAAFLLSSALVAGCAAPPAEKLPVNPPAPHARLIDASPALRKGAPLARGEYVALNDVSHPTLTSVRPIALQTDCAAHPSDAALRDCSVSGPRQSRARWAIVETSRARRARDDYVAAESKAADDMRLRFALPWKPDGQVKDPLTLPKRASQRLLAQLAPDLAERDVSVPIKAIPSGAELRFAIGIEQPAWYVDSAPVDFVIRARRAGKDQEIFRARLDPTRNERDRDWRTASVPLDALGSEPLQLVFSTRSAEPGDTRPSLPVWGDPTIVAPGKPPGKPRRIVLVSLDTLRARSMSLYGYALETTPAFEELARQGTLFERAFTTYSNTLGSHMSMFTGLYPRTHRVSHKHPHLGSELPTLAERLRTAGYETGAFTEDGLLNAEAGFRRGFAHYYENESIDRSAGDAEATFDRGLAWMKQQGDLPFFAFLHTYEVHFPYDPPQDARHWFAGEERPRRPTADIPKLHLDNEVLYEQEIRHLDQLVARLVAGLAELGPIEDLLLVITADHGEEFLEHGDARHSQLYDEVMHVPLFMRWPSVVPAGRTVEAPVSLVDIVPTILELSGVPALAQADGTSLLPLLQGKHIERDSVFGETPTLKSFGKVRSGRYVARSPTAKCIVAEEDGWVECFDLIADPEERKPVAPDSNPALAALHEQALEYRRLAREGESKRKKLPETQVVDEEREEKLRMLGYVE